MWLLILMSGRWYAVDYVEELGLRDSGLDNMFEHVNTGNVVCVADDLETWCDEMNVEQDSVIITEAV